MTASKADAPMAVLRTTFDFPALWLEKVRVARVACLNAGRIELNIVVDIGL